MVFCQRVEYSLIRCR